jgi:hypothetical protein
LMTVFLVTALCVATAGVGATMAASSTGAWFGITAFFTVLYSAVPVTGGFMVDRRKHRVLAATLLGGWAGGTLVFVLGGIAGVRVFKGTIGELAVLLTPVGTVVGMMVMYSVRSRDERGRVGLCPLCGYDRGGLAQDAACPECGGRAMGG